MHELSWIDSHAPKCRDLSALRRAIRRFAESWVFAMGTLGLLKEDLRQEEKVPTDPRHAAGW
jgi:hypothetical protein